jgi:hypothetical protein
VRNADIVFGGSGISRTLTVAPLAGQSGSADITVTVSDGFATVSSTFQLKVQQKPPLPGPFRIVSGP